MTKAFDKLSDFILNQMRMSHIYQPVMLIEILKKNGSGLTSSSLFYAREDMKEDYSVEDKMIIQSRIGRYKKAAGKYLDNICNGIFP